MPQVKRGLITEANLEAEGIDFTEVRRLACYARPSRLRSSFRRTPRVSPLHLSNGKTVITQIDRFPIDQKRSYHAVIILDFSEKSVAYLDPLVISSIPPGERTIEREKFDEVHLLTLVVDRSS